MPPETPNQSEDRFSGKAVAKRVEHFFSELCEQEICSGRLIVPFLGYLLYLIGN